MAKRQCPYCGKYTLAEARQCPFCREPLTPVPTVLGHGAEGAQKQIRRGLLYMLIAAAVYYLAGDSSAVKLPFTILPEIRQYLIPFLFLSGLALLILGIYRRVRF